MGTQIQLIVAAGPLKGQAFSFAEHDTFIFGRMADCHCCLPDDGQVSRHHFIVEANPPDARDFGCLNGTWANVKKSGSRAKGETPVEAPGVRHVQCALVSGE